MQHELSITTIFLLYDNLLFVKYKLTPYNNVSLFFTTSLVLYSKHGHFASLRKIVPRKTPLSNHYPIFIFFSCYSFRQIVRILSCLTIFFLNTRTFMLYLYKLNSIWRYVRHTATKLAPAVMNKLSYIDLKKILHIRRFYREHHLKLSRLDSLFSSFKIFSF